MTAARNFVPGIAMVAVVLLARDAHAVRFATRPLLWHRTAVSGYYGEGLPVGNFESNDVPGDGNQAEGPVDWAVEVEHFAGRTWSIGFSTAHTTYLDKTDPTLETNLSTYSGFFRVVVPTATAIRPYFRAGMGAVQVEFEQDGAYRFDADYSFSFQAGAGLLWLPMRWLGLNAQALYYLGSTEDASLGWEAADYFGLDVPPVVGFDVQYFAFAVGVSFLFP